MYVVLCINFHIRLVSSSLQVFSFKMYRDILNIYYELRNFVWSEGWTVMTESIVYGGSISMNYDIFGLGEARAISDILQSCFT